MLNENLPEMEFSWEGNVIVVSGNALARDKCSSLVEQTLARYGSRKGYYRNTNNSHLVGRSGELAVANVLTSKGESIEIAFSDPNRDAMADIVWRQLQVDVKTWTDSYWEKWGRCIAVKQYEVLKSKATHIVWCTSSILENPNAWRVKLVGWNLVLDISKFPKRWTGPAGKQVYNYQADEVQLRSMQELVGH